MIQSPTRQIEPIGPENEVKKYQGENAKFKDLFGTKTSLGTSTATNPSRGFSFGRTTVEPVSAAPGKQKPERDLGHFRYYFIKK